MEAVKVVQERLAIAKAYVAGLGANQAFQEDLGFLSFVLTLLPIPGVQQAAQVTQRLADNRNLSLQMDEIWQAIAATNQQIRLIDDLDGRIDAIANTVNYNSEIQRKLEQTIADLRNDLAESDSSWAVETSGYSTQELIDVLVRASNVTISATDHSKNVLQQLHVTARQTKLVANNGSHNSIKNSTFAGQNGSVEMTGDHIQRGDVTLRDAGIMYGENSHTQSGNWRMGTQGDSFVFSFIPPAPPPSLVCPKCRREVAAPAVLRPLLQMACPHCGNVANLPRS